MGGTVSTTTEAQTTLATQLRQAADWIDAHPVDANVHVDWTGIKVYVHPVDADEFRAARRLMGPMEKDEAAGGGMKLFAAVDGIKVTIFAPSDVCRQEQVGTERRPVTETVETGEFEDVPVYEWECGPVLAGDPEAVSA